MSKRRKSLIGLSKEEIGNELESIGSKKFAVQQIWSWIYCFGVTSFADMTNLSKGLRKKLEENYSIERCEIVKDLISVDKTRKWLLKLGKDAEVEMVYIPEEDRGTLCISSQIGCGMGCSFCKTGTQSLARNMTAGEIVQQFMIARDSLDEWGNLAKGIGKGRRVTNVVFMGMGEPLANYENVVKAVKVLTESSGIAFSQRRITISTCGIVDKIKKLPKDVKVNLAISLHASTDEVRSQIMPINKKWNIKSLMEACNYYAKNTNYRRISFEYIMIKGVNDSIENARRLVTLVRKYNIPAKFNLIPFNPWMGCDFEPADLNTVKKFAKIITDARYPCPIRKPRGQDIMAACGQLKSDATLLSE